jgi:solute carrier family 25 carnitine/acylcarnitine transporter 20/29
MNNDFINGSIGGIVGTIISHPIDTIKTRMQSNVHNNIMSAVKAGKLYSGLSAPLFGIMMEKSIVFGFYDIAKTNYGLNNFWSGMIGGFASTVIVTPIDAIKIRLQNNNFKFNIKTLYKGFIPTVFRETPGFGIYMTTYNYLNSYNKDSLLCNFIFGALSGFTAWIFIYPSDLIKTKYQAEENGNLKNIISTIYGKDKKIMNFYKNFHMAILRAVPLHGGVFLGYELSKKYFHY